MDYQVYKFKGVTIKHYAVGTPQRVLVYVHGFGSSSNSSNLQNIIDNIVPKGIAVICFDLPCHGEDPTEGPIVLSQCQNYFKVVMEFAQQKYSAKNISIFVNSFGAFLLLNYLKNKTQYYDKIIMLCPAIFMYHTIINTILPDHGYKTSDINNGPINLSYDRDITIDKSFIDAISKNSITTFNNKNYFYILQGQNDDVVDLEKNKKFFRKFMPKRHKIFYFKGADHRFKNPGEQEKIVKIVQNLLFNA